LKDETALQRLSKPDTDFIHGKTVHSINKS
jgi:hypothetical protein